MYEALRNSSTDHHHDLSDYVLDMGLPLCVLSVTIIFFVLSSSEMRDMPSACVCMCVYLLSPLVCRVDAGLHVLAIFAFFL